MNGRNSWSERCLLYVCVCCYLMVTHFRKRRNDVSFFPFVQAQIIVWVFAKSFYKKCTNENSENIGKAGVQLERNTINNYVIVPNDIKCKNENSSCSKAQADNSLPEMIENCINYDVRFWQTKCNINL